MRRDLSLTYQGALNILGRSRPSRVSPPSGGGSIKRTRPPRWCASCSTRPVRATHRRVDWTELAEQSAETIRVVLLDGLDELLQAAGDRAGYLQEVADFQRREAEQDRPVVIVVTSRTVVADRIRLPDGTIVVKLEDFDEDQIAAWCQVWNHANTAAIEAGRVRAVTPAAAATQAELARQPLLLLMLALYCADPSLPSLESHVSKAALYRRLLETFTHREVAKTHEGSRADVIDEAVQEQLWRLTSSEPPEAVEEDAEVRLRELCRRIDAERLWTDDGDPLTAARAVCDGYKHPGSVGSLELIPVEREHSPWAPAPSADSARHIHLSDGTAAESPRE